MTVEYAEDAIGYLEEFVRCLEDAIEAARGAGTHSEESLMSLLDMLRDSKTELKDCEAVLARRDFRDREDLRREYERGVL